MGAVGFFGEKDQLRDKDYGTLNEFLRFKQVCNRRFLGFDKSAVKCFFVDQGQVTGVALDKLLSQVVIVIRMQQLQVAKKEIDLSQQNSKHARQGLPEEKLIVESDLGKRELQLTIALIIKQKFKIVREFGYIHNDGIFFELPYDIGLLFIDFDPGVEKLEDQAGNTANFTGEITAVVIVGTFEYPGQPLVDFSADEIYATRQRFARLIHIYRMIPNLSLSTFERVPVRSDPGVAPPE
jgi:hypothetical protein